MFRMEKVNRVEIIDESGRSYVRHLSDDQKVAYSMQDDDRTLKIFISKGDEHNAK